MAREPAGAPRRVIYKHSCICDFAESSRALVPSSRWANTTWDLAPSEPSISSGDRGRARRRFAGLMARGLDSRFVSIVLAINSDIPKAVTR
jgi:hypothetical protein